MGQKDNVFPTNPSKQNQYENNSEQKPIKKMQSKIYKVL